MLKCEQPRTILDVQLRDCGTIYAVMADAATIRAWVANPKGASITMIPCDTQRDAVDTCLRLARHA